MPNQATSGADVLLVRILVQIFWNSSSTSSTGTGRAGGRVVRLGVKFGFQASAPVRDKFNSILLARQR